MWHVVMLHHLKAMLLFQQFSHTHTSYCDGFVFNKQILSEGVGEPGEVDNVFQSDIQLTSHKTGQHNYKGSHCSLLEIGVAGVRGVSTLIYEKENFDGHFHKLEGPVPLVSLRFLPKDCANIPIYPDLDAVIVVTICLAVFAARGNQRGVYLGYIFQYP